MPPERLVVGFCWQYYATFNVPSSKDPDVKYQVTLNGPNGMAHCTCPAFKFFKGDELDRTCKHVSFLWKHACLWNPQWYAGGPNDLQALGVTSTGTLSYRTIHGETCPKCGGPVCPVAIAV